MSAYYIGIDIGGTFTDCAVLTEQGTIATIAKSPTRRQDPGLGVMDVLAVAAEQLDLSRTQLLQSCRYLLHGCTVATNAMVERSGVKTGLLTTAGHEDAIFIGKVLQKAAGLRESEMIHQSQLDKANPPLVAPECIIGVRERVDRDGAVVVALDVAGVAAGLDRLRRQGVEAVAISLLWSFQNPAHEEALRRFVEAHCPDWYLSVSHELAPVLGEYERTVTTVANAYVGPKVLGYLQRLATALAEEGLGAPLLVAHASGGLTTWEEIQAKPLLTLDSGPVSGVLGARFFGQLYGEPNILCADVGGTTFDVSLIEGGRTVLDEAPVIGQYQYLQPKIAVRSIGAGGGSILWIDADGLLKVGPASAGAEPGPACYDQGGQAATITDANVALGYLNPDNFLGGRRRLHAARAREALAQLGAPLGFTPLDVAAGGFRIINAQMADLVRQVSIDQGYDPRAFALFCYGGAGPIHMAFLARELRLKRVYIPSFATVFSAVGMLTGGLLHTRERALAEALPLTGDRHAAIVAMMDDLQDSLHRLMDREGVPSQQRHVQRWVSMKYRMQPTALLVPWGDGDSEHIGAAFEAQYRALYGPQAGFRQAGIELVKCRVDASAPTVLPQMVARPVAATISPDAARVGQRLAFFEDAMQPTTIYRGEGLEPGMQIAGPAIIERMGDTVVVPPKVRILVDGFHNLLMEMD